ncbi:MAG: 4Fe-4S double cluster binding domain-containing protein [Candidatus Hodarchaeales archaeon]
MIKNENLVSQELFKNRGIKIIGIASMDDVEFLKKAPFSPQTLLPEAASVICYAIPIPKGIIFSNSHSVLLYWRFCNMTYRNLDIITNTLCLSLEEEGYLSTPIYGCYPWKVVNREFHGLIPLVYWAEQAGIGKLTRSGLLGNPKFGTRLLIGGVITTKALPASKKLEEDICPNECAECIDACPVKAISISGKVDHNKCIRYSSKNPLFALVLKDTDLKKGFNFDTILNTVGVDDHGTYNCLECIRACPLNTS